MDITIENCSSPGAHFSKNTNGVLLKIDEWIIEHNYPKLTFIEFRRNLEHDKGINDNNARNIYPLLKNSGLVEYQPRGDLNTKYFFTNRGKAYLETIKTIALVKGLDYSEEKKEKAVQQLTEIMESIICDSVERILKNQDLNYSEGLRWYLEYLQEYGKINKKEFAYMVYLMHSPDKENWKEKSKDIILAYRNKEIDINVSVRVRNDQKIKQVTQNTVRLEKIDFFTAYLYYSALINQTGITRKLKDYYYLNESMHDKLISLLEAE